MAFRLFATGRYSIEQLRRALTDAGLRTGPTKAYSAGSAVTASQLTKILTDRSYLSYVLWRGEEHPGKHPALVDPVLFDRLPRVFASRHRGTRDANGTTI
jgi:site-specific DNA recombinase